MRAIRSSFSPAIRRSHLRSSSSLNGAVVLSLLAVMSAASAHAAGDPVVVSGGITIASPTAHSTVVTQAQDKGIINWNGGMDVLSGDSLRFAVPTAQSITLNHITNGKPTKIDGSLSSNGRLVVVNPSGMMVGAGGSVNVSSLIATTADIANADFLAGKLNFDKASANTQAGIVNKGQITATDGGLVALVAPSVRNDGVIQAKLGQVVLGGGQSFRAVDLYGDGLYSFKLTDAASSGNKVENHGAIRATGGTVLLTANAAKSVVDQAINTDGIIEASSASIDKTGAIVLDGGQGDVRVAGKLDASGEKGGSVQVTGANIQLASAIIDASGATGGGQVAIGGGAQGTGSIPHAATVQADAASRIDVSAKTKGNGGSVVVWSDKNTQFAGKITGTGGAQGGKGGQAEVSSAGQLSFTGLADLHGVNDTNGTLLIDPADITIGLAEAAAYDLTLNSNTDVVIATGNTGAGNGNITVNAPISWASGSSLTLNSFGNTILNADIGGLGGSTIIVAGKNIVLNNASIGSFTGNISLTGVDVSLAGASGLFTFGNIAINNSGVFQSTNAGSVNSFGSGTITLNQSAAGSVQNAIDAIGAHGPTTLTLGAGLFDEHFVIDRGDFSLVGSGSGNTFIRPTSLVGAPVVTVDGTDYQSIVAVQSAGFVNVSNLTITNSGLADPSAAIGLSVQNGNIFSLNNSILLGGVGVALQNTPNASITNNIILGEDYGLTADGSNNLIVSGNYLQGDTAVLLSNQTGGSVLANGIATPQDGTYGVYAENVNGLDVNNNSITAGDTAVRIDTGGNVNIIGNNALSGQYGAYANDVQNLTITANGFTVDPSQFQSGGPIIPFPIITPPFPTIAVNVDGGSGVTVNNNFLSADLGVVGSNIGGLSIISNQIVANVAGVALSSSLDSTIATNNIFAGVVGVDLSGDTRTNVSVNQIQNATTGISANGETDLTLFANNLTNISSGIVATNVTNLNATFNAAAGRGDAGSVGFLVQGSNNAALGNNYLQFFDDGIHLLNSNAAALTANFAGNGLRGIFVDASNAATINGGNTLANNSVGGVVVAGSTGTNVSGNFFNTNLVGVDVNGDSALVIDNNAHFGDVTAIRVANSTGATISNNQFTAQATGLNGIQLLSSDNALILGNVSNDLTNVGIGIGGSNNVTVSANDITGAANGLVAVSSDGLSINANDFVNNGTAVSLLTSDNASIFGGTFSGNNVGVSLNVSQNARIDSTSIATAAGGTGIEVLGGSGNAVLRNTSLSGGDIGVRIADAGSALQFESNGSTFDGMGQYFVLENGAMVGTTLDASAQTFDGARASDFTLAQRDAAEGITTDVADNAALGNVFYKDFPATTPPPVDTIPGPDGSGGTGGTGGTLDLTALNEFQLERTFLFRNGLFSYAGRTIANNVAQTPYTFQVAAVNLSLLAPAAGGANPAGGASQLANLSTASGGTGTGEGSGAEQLASLSPAAGAGLDCGNSFLGAGYQPGFEAGNCRVNPAR